MLAQGLSRNSLRSQDNDKTCPGKPSPGKGSRGGLCQLGNLLKIRLESFREVLNSPHECVDMFELEGGYSSLQAYRAARSLRTMMHLRADGETTVECGDCGFDRANGDGPELQLHLFDDYAILR